MSAESAAVEGGKGNSETFPNRKREPEKKTYCFTLHDYTENMCQTIIKSAELYKYIYVFGKEICPDTKRPHLQGFIEWATKTSFTAIKKKLKIDTMHFIPAKGNKESNITYCTKDGDYYSNIPSLKKAKPIKLIENLREWQQNVVDYTMNEPDGRHLLWIVDIVGGKGKSTFSKYMFIKHKCLVIQGGKLQDIMNIIFNTDMDEINTVIIDIPRVNKNKVSYASIECILNGMITNTKYETGVKVFNPPHVIVFSNFYPDEETLSADRWIIKEI